MRRRRTHIRRDGVKAVRYSVSESASRAVARNKIHQKVAIIDGFMNISSVSVAKNAGGFLHREVPESWMVENRSREFLWQGHTAHATKEDADKEVFEALDHYRHIYEEYFAVPVVKGMKSEKKFAETGCGIQGAKMFDITFTNKEGKNKSCGGILGLIIGVMILTYGDDKGLVNPPNVAPIQVRLSEEGNGLDVCDS
ncbi:hypothetical protein HID58_073830 [Brassica napus]|uniref:Uncharacterized protein n=1 Tax=Brassica napus TaxID=3708 RepID=A0ABQ7YEY5_BRANA|nr:hypothetical protein HID58_073830 [Brassica napus]